MNAPENVARDALVVAGKSYSSRLLVGTGKYRDFDETRRAIEASGAGIVTVAIRRTNIGQNKGEPSILEVLPPARFTILPNTAGCYTAQDAVRTLRLARELLDGHALVKLEVLGDAQSLYPNMPETIAAAKTLVAEGFQVMAYCSDDPIMARQLEELGCDGVLMNTAIAKAREPVRMARAMKLAVEAGREAFLAGRMPRKPYDASPSSPLDGMIQGTDPSGAR